MNISEKYARDGYSMTLLSRGAFIDQPGGPDALYTVEVDVYRLSPGAHNSWLYESPQAAEAMAREYLGLPPLLEKDCGGIHMTRHGIKDILTIVKITRVKAAV